MKTGNFSDFDIRQLVAEVGGPRRADEPLSFYFNRVARKVGISSRCVRAAWNREITHPYSKTAIKLREASKHVEVPPTSELAALKQRIELLERRLHQTHEEFYRFVMVTAGEVRDTQGRARLPLDRGMTHATRTQS